MNFKAAHASVSAVIPSEVEESRGVPTGVPRDSSTSLRSAQNERGAVMWVAIICTMLVAFTSCQTTTTSSHRFAAPSPGWSTKTGQLAYTDQKVSLIGEVLVRYSKQGEFELTFTKAGGITLLSLRQDAGFGQVEGPLARRGWSGPIGEAPASLRGWFELRDKIVNGRKSATIRHDAGQQTFTLRF